MARYLAMILLSGVSLAGCGDKEETEDSTGGTEDTGCGEATFFDITVRAKVEDDGGRPLEGMEVVIDDEANTATGALGSGVTDAQGMVEFLASQVELREGCLGTLYNYQAIATDPSGTYGEGKEEMNANLYGATTDGTMVADVTAFPIVMSAL